MLTGRFTFELLVLVLVLVASKKRKYSCNYKPEIRKKFRCTICDSNISLAHSGQGDIEKHNETNAHKDNVKSVERTLNFFHRSTQSDLPP